MASIIEIYNPFEPLADTKVHAHPGGITISDWLRRTYPGFREFTHPTICIVNGHPLMRREWPTRTIAPNDVVNFVTCPKDPLTIFYVFLAVTIVAAVYFVLTIPDAPTPGQTPEADPVYDLKGQRNQIKLGYPIEVPYGRCRLWPSYAARAYNKYTNNDQYQYQLLCLGQGYFDVEDVQIEDTPIANFEDINYAIYGPGEAVTLFPDNVITSVEVGGIELFGPNEEDYAGYSGPFVANDIGTLCTKLEVDVVLVSGLYYTQDNGTLGNKTVTATFEYRLIDDAGAPLGSWTAFPAFSKTLKTNTPQRFTLELDVDAGRYEVRARRTNNKDTSARAGNTLRWDGLRAFLPSTKNYGDVTLLAVVARASNNLNDRSSNRINVWATRKLRKWNKLTQTWTARTATRSIAWAFADIFQAQYGGRLPDSFLDLDGLYDLDAIYTSRGENFDYVFDQRATVWELARTIARAGRAVPMLNGSKVTLVRDAIKSIPTCAFGPDTIIEGSFSHQYKLSNLDDYDGIEIEYTDPDTFKSETVLCKIGSDLGENPEKIKLNGVTSRAHAYREGMYMRACRRYLRENITFKTGLEGHIPSYGDLIALSHDLPRWGQSGQLISIDGTTLTLTEPVVFGSGTHVIGLRKKDGSVSGPHTCTAGAAPNKVVLAAPISSSDFIFDESHERPLFLFGKTEEWAQLCVVVSLAPADNDEVEVKCVPYDARVFANDGATPPAKPTVPIPPKAPGLPAVTNLVVTAKANTANTILVSWSAALGALRYLVQVSFDAGVTWSETHTTTSTSIVLQGIKAQTIDVRVAAVGSEGQGSWTIWSGLAPVPATNVQVDLGQNPSAPTSVITVSGFNTIWLEWENPTGPNAAEIAVYVSNTTTKPGTPTDILAIPQNSYVVTDLPAGATRYFWLEARSVGGLLSSTVGPVTGTARTGIVPADLSPGLVIPEVVTSLPTSGNYKGRIVFLTTNNKLYRWTDAAVTTGTAYWTAEVAAVDLAGQIGSTQIADGAISTPKLAAGAVTANEIAANTITAAKMAANSIVAGAIAAGAITADKIGTNEVIALTANIKDAIITGAKIASATIGTANIQDAAITNAKINDLDVSKLNAGTISSKLIEIAGGTSGIIQSSGFVAGSSGWRIRGNGDAEFNTLTIRVSDSVSGTGSTTVGDDGTVSVCTTPAKTWLARNVNVAFAATFANSSGNATVWDITMRIKVGSAILIERTIRYTVSGGSIRPIISVVEPVSAGSRQYTGEVFASVFSGGVNPPAYILGISSAIIQAEQLVK